MNDNKEQSGFRDIPQDKWTQGKRREPCMSQYHQPPMHMVIPAGKEYVHICPQCGERMVLRNNMRASL